MGKKIAILLVVVAAAGGATYAAMRFTAAPDDGAISLVPKDAAIYGTVYVEPSTSQRSNLDSILSKLPEVDSLDEAKSRLVELIDPELEKIGLEYERDIEPWLGSQAAFFAVAPADGGGEPEDVGVLVSAEDEDAARSAVEKGIERSGDPEDWSDASYEGIGYRTRHDDSAFGFVGGFLVAGTESGFKAAVDASTGENLGDSAKYQKATELLNDDRIALAYFDSAQLIEAAQGVGGLPSENVEALETFGASGAVAISLHAEEDAVVFESASELPKEGALRDIVGGYEPGSGLIGSFPGDSWLALSLQDSGRTLDASIDAITSAVPGFDRTQLESMFESSAGLDLNEDVLSWMGDAGLFVQGTNLQEIGGALVVSSDDPDKTIAAVEKLQDLAATTGLPTRPLERDGLTGFTAQAPGMPAPVNLLGGDRLIVAYGDRATGDAVDPDDTLDDSDAYGAATDALGDGYATVLYLDGQGMISLIESGMSFSGETDPTYEEDVKPYLDHLAFVVAGVRVEGDAVVQRFAIGAR